MRVRLPAPLHAPADELGPVVECVVLSRFKRAITYTFGNLTERRVHRLALVRVERWPEGWPQDGERVLEVSTSRLVVRGPS